MGITSLFIKRAGGTVDCHRAQGKGGGVEGGGGGGEHLNIILPFVFKGMEGVFDLTLIFVSGRGKERGGGKKRDFF